MKTSLRITMCLLALMFLIAPLAAVSAQGDNTPALLYAVSKDSKHPVLLQALDAGQEADSANLKANASVKAGTTDATVYIAFNTTGWWTQAVIGLLSGSLVRENQYVAIEVDDAGAPVENGRAFALNYRAGYFLLPAVIEKPVKLGIFQIATEGGDAFKGQTAALDGTTLTQSEVEFQIVPEMPLGNIILDCHITAPAAE